MKVLVGSFNQAEALVGAFSVIVQLRRLIVFSNIKHTNIHQANAKQTQLAAASSPDAIMPTILSQSLVGPALKHDR